MIYSAWLNNGKVTIVTSNLNSVIEKMESGTGATVEMWEEVGSTYNCYASLEIVKDGRVSVKEEIERLEARLAQAEQERNELHHMIADSGPMGRNYTNEQFNALQNEYHRLRDWSRQNSEDARTEYKRKHDNDGSPVDGCDCTLCALRKAQRECENWLLRGDGVS